MAYRTRTRTTRRPARSVRRNVGGRRVRRAVSSRRSARGRTTAQRVIVEIRQSPAVSDVARPFAALTEKVVPIRKAKF